MKLEENKLLRTIVLVLAVIGGVQINCSDIEIEGSSYCARTKPFQWIWSLHTCRHEPSRYPPDTENNFAYLKVDDAVAAEFRSISEAREKISHSRPKTVPETVTSAGYPIQVYEVTTEDGYLLTLYRIPHGRNEFDRQVSSIEKPPVLLQHGMFTFAGFWLTQTDGKNLPYILADNGYDVWLGNSRGTVVSQRHINLTSQDEKFWRFDWEDMGLYDLPAVIDFMLKTNGNKKIYYIGHSQGTTQFFVGLSMRPEYNDKIRLMIAYAPIGFVYHVTSVARMAAPLGFEPFLPFSHGLSILPRDAVIYLSELAGTFCDPGILTVTICSNLLFILVGFDSNQTNATQLYEFMQVTVNPVSLKSVQHFAQGLIWNEFRRLNFGAVRNCQVYGTCTPPSYNISAITAPVAAFYGLNDLLANTTDVFRFLKKLPNLVLNYTVPSPYWNHLDFVTSVNVRNLIFQPTLEIMKRF